MAQLILGTLTFVVLGVVTFLMYKKRVNERPDIQGYAILSMDYLLELVKREMIHVTRNDDIIMASDINYEAISRNKRRIEKALTDSVYGIKASRKIIIAMIRDIIQKEIKDFDELCKVIDFTDLHSLMPMIKFEVLLNVLEYKHGGRIIQYLDAAYGISELRLVESLVTGENKKLRMLDDKLLDTIFQNEIIDTGVLEDGYAKGLDIIAILLFQKYKGFGCIDTLIGLEIDGLNFGTSGSIRYEIEGKFDAPYRRTNSVWVQINARWVHFSFLDFFKVSEMKRVVTQLASWGVSSPMNEKKPVKVNDLADGSRVTTIRPPSGEAWAAFVRKFSVGYRDMNELLEKPGIGRSDLPRNLIKFLMKAECTTAFTGQQNTGKTTMMKAAIDFVELVNIRALEMSFELHLGEIFPDRNVFIVKPTDYISGSALQDTLKKTDGYMSLVGEVAEDIIAARMIQFCLIASAFTIFSHHGKDDHGLIHGLANSLVACGEYKNHETAISTVLDAIHNNVHLRFFGDERVIDYISEIVKNQETEVYPKVEYPEDILQALHGMVALNHEFYTRSTDRVRFSSRKIIEFDEATASYVAKEWYTPETTAYMLNKLKGRDRDDFIKFYRDNWGEAVS